MQLRKAGKPINDAIAIFGKPSLCCAIAIYWSNTVKGEGEIGRDLPPEAPSFITRVCGLEFHILRRQLGQARRARSPQIAQALDALRPVFGSEAMSAA